MVNMASLKHLEMNYVNLSMAEIFSFNFPPTPSFLNLTQLHYLDLSSNDFYGDISSEFGTLLHMEELYLWYNYNLRVNFSNLFGGSWKNIKIGYAPSWTILTCLGELSSLKVLTIENIMLQGSPPYITLATNSYTYIDLSYNKFTGPIPFLTNLVYFLDISYDQFSGVIPSLFGKMKGLKILNLSHNNLTGGVPPTLAKCGSLKVLDLKANHLSGNIPWSSIHGNEFSGSLQSWIGVTLFNLQILQLRSHSKRGTYYKERVDVSMNGFVYEYTTNFALVIVLDLSNNNLLGTIPEEIGDLIGLIALNLSRNRFFGKLPQSIGRLQQLINLDLSRNRLFGSILAAIASLTFLSYLNLSYNNFSKIIPSGNRLDILNDESIYVGNEHLCGYPLRKKCKSDGRDQISVQTIDDEEFKDGFEIRWIYADIALGFVVGFVSVFGILLFKSYKYYSSSNSRELSNPKVTLLPMELKGRRNTKQSKDTTPKRTYGDIPWKKDRVETMIRPTHSHWYTAFF
ncbi:receptor-like protein EIX1 [Aristolochia californica]|uniref:receptor-like protein EIX1 n=1 Tax=Aristolochia californica TaxID=171875 RepID=UPI0035D699E9